MTIYQLHRTSASSSGRPGWRVTAYTPGLSQALCQEIVGLLTSELAVDARRTRPQRDVPGSGQGHRSAAARQDAGVTLSYSLLADGAALICRTVDAGRDFAGRPGNAFQHALLLSEPDRDLVGLLPADLWWWSGWDGQPFHGELSAVESLVVDLSLPRRAAIGRARELHRDGRLAALLASVRRGALSSPAVRIVLVEPVPATTIRTIRLATGSLPRALALTMTFGVHVGQPEQSHHVLVGVPVGADLDPAAVSFGVRFEIHHLYAWSKALPVSIGAPRVADDASADGSWGMVAAQVWAAGRPDTLAAAYASFADADAAERLADAAAGAGVPLSTAAGQPAPGGSRPETVAAARIPARAGMRAGATATAGPAPRARLPVHLPVSMLTEWVPRLQLAGSTIGGYARAVLMFSVGALIAFGQLGARLLALPFRTLAAEPPVLRPADGEAAYPAYFARDGQASVDLGAIRDALADALSTARPAFAAVGPARWPGRLAGTTTSARRCRRMWAAGTATGVAAAGGLAQAVLAVHRALVAVATAALQTVGVVLRLMETARWLLREVRPRLSVATLRLAGEMGVDCPYPDCARPLGRPFYQCPSETCGRRHDDLRPGRGGLLYRVCACGTRLRTWAPGRRGRLASFCGSCSGRLPDGVGHLPIVHIALIGPPASGKTTLLVASLAGLHDLAFQGDLAVSFAFRQDEEWYRHSVQVLAEGGRLESTATPNPRALVVTVGIPRGPRRIVFFFDPDGDLYTDQETLRTTHRYLERTRNALLVVDPAAQPALLTRLTLAQREDAFEAAHPAAEPTYDTMRRLVRVLRADRSLPRRGGRIALRLAVVVSKTDWLRGLPPILRLPDLTPGQQDALVRQWLSRSARLPELALQPSMEFTETRYWALSAADCLRDRDEGPDPAARVAAAEPVLWMLAASARRYRSLVARQQNPQQAGRRPTPHAPIRDVRRADSER